jgi:hypothetical protein
VSEINNSPSLLERNLLFGILEEGNGAAAPEGSMGGLGRGKLTDPTAAALLYLSRQ